MSRRKALEAWSGAENLPYACDPVAQVLTQGKHGMTLEEIALCLGVVRERVRQIQDEALAKVLQALRDEGWSDADLQDWLASLAPRTRD